MSKNLTPEQKEYNDFIKASVADGSYFKDARDWYILRYVYPVCERTILFFIASFAGVIFYILAATISSSLPIKQEVPIIIRPTDQSKYFPVIKKLKDSVELRNVDEAVSKYLIAEYIKKREGYDFRKTNLEDLNKQLKYVKNNSSLQEYSNFQNFLSKDNKNTPINYFGRDFQRIVDIDSVTFVTQNVGTLIEKARDFVKAEVPSEVSVRYRVTTKINSVNVSSERYLVKIKFKFSGIKADKGPDSKLDFMVIGYKIYKIK
jgi:type IV secretion system protein VirB8